MKQALRAYFGKPHQEHPDERRRPGYNELEHRLNRFFVKALFAFAVIGMTSAIALFGFGFVLHSVQETRKKFVRDTCLDQNHRHDKTIALFYKAARDFKKKHPEQAKVVDDSVQTNITLIDALAPKRDCKKLSQVAIGEADPPPPGIPTKPNRKR